MECQRNAKKRQKERGGGGAGGGGYVFLECLKLCRFRAYEISFEWILQFRSFFQALFGTYPNCPREGTSGVERAKRTICVLFSLFRSSIWNRKENVKIEVLSSCDGFYLWFFDNMYLYLYLSLTIFIYLYPSLFFFRWCCIILYPWHLEEKRIKRSSVESSRGIEWNERYIFSIEIKSVRRLELWNLLSV